MHDYIDDCDHCCVAPPKRTSYADRTTSLPFQKQSLPTPSCNGSLSSVRACSPWPAGEPILAAAVVGIAAFPIELLTEVFTYLVWTRPAQSDLIAATQVCRRWRIAALGDPSLWTHVAATCLRRAQVSLERSYPLLVDVSISSTGDARSMMQLLQDHAGRLRSLRVESGHCPTTVYYLTHLSRIRVPVLETLHVGGPEINSLVPYIAQFSVNPSGSSEPSKRLSKTSEDSPMPHLQKLHLCPFAFTWNSPIYQTLSHIDLRAPGMPPPTMRQLLSILHRCPDLQSFRLHTSLLLPSPVQMRQDHGDEWRVHLPRLSSFHLDGPPLPQMVELLERLTLPPTTRFTLSTQVIPPMPTRFPALPGNCHHLPTLASFRALAFTQLDQETIRLACAHGEGDARDADSEPTLVLTLRVADVADALASISSFVDVASVHALAVTLSLQSNRPTTGVGARTVELTMADWCAALGELHALRSLRLSGLSNNSLRCAVSALRTPRPGASGPLLCPALAEIALEEVEMPCRVSTDVLWLCDERRKLGRGIGRIGGAGCGALSDRCMSGLRAGGIEIGV